jgi:hypothetical protein
MGGIPLTLAKGTSVHIPSSVVHCAIPVDESCHLLIVTVPAIREYASREP